MKEWSKERFVEGDGNEESSTEKGVKKGVSKYENIWHVDQDRKTAEKEYRAGREKGKARDMAFGHFEGDHGEERSDHHSDDAVLKSGRFKKDKKGQNGTELAEDIL